MQEADPLPERGTPRSMAPADYLALLSTQLHRRQQTTDTERKNAHSDINDSSGLG